MPCRMDDCPGRSFDDQNTITFLTAALCAVLTAVEHEKILKDILGSIDYDEAGFTFKKLEGWWKHHKKQDSERRKREAAQKKEEDLRQKALAKLTRAERQLLGLE